MGSGHDNQLGWGGQACEEDGMGKNHEEFCNSILWPSKKKKKGFGALFRFQLPIHVHPNKNSGIAVYFNFLVDLILQSNSI
jgi:hypothetical protein